MKIIAVFFIAIAINGCASHSIYSAAKDDGIGYKEVAIAENHYRVQFKANGSTRNIAQKYALLRSAELTLAQGYDWFVVEKRKFHTIDEPDDFATRPRSITTRSCGLLGCRTSTQIAEQSLGIPEAEAIIALVEIRMGRGVRPEQYSYDAREVWETQQIQ